ncbi:MAG TPA: HlyD family secretion protein [Bryobacteraceae bacterium]|jgi:membrane fusion protein (multidrug efflux system)|nr:HlyD family secretion protein [Bryobacteraceae bacterium]
MATVLDPETQTRQKAGEKAPVFRKRPSVRKKILAAAAFLAFIGASAWVIRYWLWAQAHEETDDAYVAGHVHPVSARIAGTVEAVLVDDNQHVKRGQVLVRLDPRDYQVRLAHAKAALDVARRQAASAGSAVEFSSESATAKATEADGGVRSAQAEIAAAKASVAEASAGIPRAQAALAEAEANRRRAELDYQRYADLAAKDQVSRQQFDHARTALDAAIAGKNAAAEAVRQAEARLVQARESVGRAQAQLVEAQGEALSARAAGTETTVHRRQHEAAVAAIAQAESALEDAKLQLSYTEVRSPVSGRVGRKGVEAGQRLQPGQPLLAIVEDDLWVVANYKETQLTHMKPRQPVEITIDSFPEHTFRGHVDSMSPGTGAQFALLPPDNATGNFTKIVQRVPVKIRFDRESVRGYESFIVPGMSVVAVTAVR